jgi:hypothetical protein
MPFVEAKNEKITQNFIVFEENETIGISLAAIALDLMLRKIIHICAKSTFFAKYLSELCLQGLLLLGWLRTRIR